MDMRNIDNMEDDQKASSDNKKSRTPPKPRVSYSRELVDRIADKIAEDLSFTEISHFAWAPSRTTLFKWATNDAYAAQKFHEARTTHLEERKRDRITELKHTKLEDIALECDSLPVSPGIKTQLFKEKVSWIKTQIDIEWKELEVDIPEKYVKKVQQSIDVTDKAKSASTADLQQRFLDLVKMINDRSDVLFTNTEQMKQAESILKKTN